MKKFLKTVFEFIFKSMFCFFAFCFLGMCILISEDQAYKFKDLACLFFWGGMTILSLWFWHMVSKLKLTEEIEPEEKPKTETNIDNPKESDDVVVVTEIQGERKIIKNGKVIYSEKLKADELKVFEKLKDKN